MNMMQESTALDGIPDHELTLLSQANTTAANLSFAEICYLIDFNFLSERKDTYVWNLQNKEAQTWLSPVFSEIANQNSDIRLYHYTLIHAIALFYTAHQTGIIKAYCDEPENLSGRHLLALADRSSMTIEQIRDALNLDGQQKNLQKILWTYAVYKVPYLELMHHQVVVDHIWAVFKTDPALVGQKTQALLDQLFLSI